MEVLNYLEIDRSNQLSIATPGIIDPWVEPYNDNVREAGVELRLEKNRV
jgi:hypothetical protein